MGGVKPHGEYVGSVDHSHGGFPATKRISANRESDARGTR
jgi:hypothetical protein